LTNILLEDGDSAALLARYDRQRRTVMNEFVQAQSVSNKKAMESADTQREFQDALEAILRDDDLRRAYLLKQAMVPSLEREAEIL
jgi:3-(3-hydroxy-phenyl)propionate hydroxylase